MRDATFPEIRDEPDVVLECLVDGTMTATWATREMAKNELEARALAYKSHATVREARAAYDRRYPEGLVTT